MDCEGYATCDFSQEDAHNEIEDARKKRNSKKRKSVSMSLRWTVKERIPYASKHAPTLYTLLRFLELRFLRASS